MPSWKHFSTSIKPSRTFHVEYDVSSINRRTVPYHTRLKSNFDRLLYIIFFITQILNVVNRVFGFPCEYMRHTTEYFKQDISVVCSYANLTSYYDWHSLRTVLKLPLDSLLFNSWERREYFEFPWARSLKIYRFTKLTNFQNLNIYRIYR